MAKLVRADVLYVGVRGPQALDPPWVDVEADDLVAHLHRPHGERQAYVALPDDHDLCGLLLHSAMLLGRRSTGQDAARESNHSDCAAKGPPRGSPVPRSQVQHEQRSHRPG